MHAFIEPGDEGQTADYGQLLSSILSEYSSFRLVLAGEEIVAIASVHRPDEFSRSSKKLVGLQFVSGSDDTITIFDQNTGEAEKAQLPKGTVSVDSTWLIWNADSRVVFIESKRPGVGKTKIEKYLQAFGRRVMGYEKFTLNLNPVASKNFESEIEKFTRIREVNVMLKRPNKNWDPAKALAGAAADSDAGTVEISARAERNQSLAKDRGIVKQVKEYSRRPITGLSDVQVFGNVPGVEGEQQIRLSQNQVETRIRLGKNATEEDVVRLLIAGVLEIELNI